MPNINDYGLPFTSQDGDRKYSALEWREYFSRLIHNGLIQNAANECQVKPQAVPNKTIYVDTGVVFINGAMRILDSPITLTVAENTSGNPRIDRVVARLNEASRTMEFAVKQGIPAGSPVAPTLTRTAGVYELGLADITLANGYSAITSGVINDQRWDLSLCGASSMTIGVIPPSGMEAETVTLNAETAARFGLSGSNAQVDKALINIPFASSYIAFCGKVNAEMLDAAFGKNNEESIYGLGRQLAMYAWFKGDSKITKPFNNLLNCDTLDDILNNPSALSEVRGNSNLTDLVLSSGFASFKLFNNLSLYSFGEINPIAGDFIVTKTVFGGVTLTKNPTNIYAVPNASNHSGCIGTSNQIDVTNYTKLFFLAKGNNTTNSKLGYEALGLMDDTPTGSMQTVDPQNEKVYQLDISAQTNIGIGAYMNAVNPVTISAIWLF